MGGQKFHGGVDGLKRLVGGGAWAKPFEVVPQLGDSRMAETSNR